MSQSDIAISARNVGKAYTIRHNAPRHTTLGEAIVHRIKHPFHFTDAETFWAVKDVSFDIRRGEVVGIIGRNGAGKSTLLKILSRITRPTTGEVDLFGRVGSLLEVGTGFHQELTGRENIYLNGSILGMTRGEISKQFDAIVDFAGVEKFLDTPVKRYSSGMYVRLAFAVAAHLRSEIMVVDEVLAVGDADFQQKCLGKMKDVATGGRTVLFVSHNMQSIVTLCDRGLLLDNGVLELDGSIDSVAERYAHSRVEQYAKSEPSKISRRAGSGQYRVSRAYFEHPVYGSDEEKCLRVQIERVRGELVNFFLVVDLKDGFGNLVFHADSRMRGVTCGDADELAGEFRFSSPWLRAGNYRVTLQLIAGALIDEWSDACGFEVTSGPYGSNTLTEPPHFGPIYADFDVTFESNQPTSMADEEAVQA